MPDEQVTSITTSAVEQQQRQAEWRRGYLMEYEVAKQAALDARKKEALAGGQLTMQDLFSNTLELAVRFPKMLERGAGIEGTYNGVPAVLECDLFVDSDGTGVSPDIEDGARFMVFAQSPDGDGKLLCDVVLTRRTTGPTWNAMQGEYGKSASRRGGNPGINWVPASDLVVGSDMQPYGLATAVRNVCEMVTGMQAPQK